MEVKDLLTDFEQESFSQDQLKRSLLSDPNILKVVEQLQLDDEIIDSNLTPLIQYQRFLQKDPTLPKGLLNNDYDVILVNEDGFLRVDYQLKKELVELNQKNEFLNNYWINHLSEKLKYVNAQDIDFDHYLDLKPVKSVLMMKPTDTRGVFLYGTVGIGKTYLLAIKANQFAAEGHKVCFVNFNRLLSELKQTFAQKTDDQFNETINKLKYCDFLVIDDIGAESVTAWTRDEILFQILDSRMEQGRLTCFSSNLDASKLAQHFSKGFQTIDEVGVVRLMERINVLSDFVLISSSKKSLRRVD